MSTITADRICQHLRSIGIQSKESSRFSSLCEKWISNNGLEWTAERLKSLKQAFMESLSLDNGSYKVPLGWATRLNSKKKVIFKDGLVHRIMCKTKNEFKLVEGFLRIYQVLKLDNPSPKQELKMFNSITNKSSANPVELELVCRNLTTPRKVSKSTLSRLKSVGDNCRTLPELTGSGTKRSPVFNVSYSGKFTYKRSMTRDIAESADWLEYFQTDKSANDFWVSYPNFVSRRLTGVNTMPYSRSLISTEDAPVGTLVVLQSDGCKARWIANPILAFQALGEPLKVKLELYSKKLYPEIDTFDQTSGHGMVIEWLQSGRKVWSFDATAFTDRFPESIQRALLRNLVDLGVASEEDFESYKLVISKKWHYANRQRDVRWVVGQPLGYGPSFHLATLAHAVILDTLDISKSNAWRVVGDDVVISDENLANRYKELMQNIGVEINLSKSLVSDKYAEFLGKLISSDGVNPSMKVRLLTSADQVVSCLAYYGINGLKYLSKKELIQGLRVFMPLELGGLDWRDNSLSYSDWLLLTNQNSWADSKIRKSIREFIGNNEYSASYTGKLLELRSEIASRNSIPLSVMEWESLVGPGQPVNLLNDLPIENSIDKIDIGILNECMNNYVHIIDKMLKLEGFNAEPTSLLLNKQGYINESEKPSTTANQFIVGETRYESKLITKLAVFRSRSIAEQTIGKLYKRNAKEEADKTARKREERKTKGNTCG